MGTQTIHMIWIDWMWSRMAKVKCPHCQEQIEKDGAVPYNKRYYCYDCFWEAFKEEECEKHFFYLTFQKIIGRVPLNLEWIQCNKLIDDGWSWSKIEDVFYYTYKIECKQVTEEYGTIGILPYVELRAKRFYEDKWNADSSNHETVVEVADRIVYTSNAVIKPSKTKKQHKNIDRLLEDDNLWDQ